MKKDPEIRRAQKYFEEHLTELLETFEGEYVAVINNEVVVHGSDLGVVVREVNTKYGQRPAYIEIVEPQHALVVPTVLLKAVRRKQKE